jgi:hypothetical protein
MLQTGKMNCKSSRRAYSFLTSIQSLCRSPQKCDFFFSVLLLSSFFSILLCFSLSHSHRAHTQLRGRPRGHAANGRRQRAARRPQGARRRDRQEPHPRRPRLGDAARQCAGRTARSRYVVCGDVKGQQNILRWVGRKIWEKIFFSFDLSRMIDVKQLTSHVGVLRVCVFHIFLLMHLALTFILTFFTYILTPSFFQTHHRTQVRNSTSTSRTSGSRVRARAWPNSPTSIATFASRCARLSLSLSLSAHAHTRVLLFLTMH